MAQAARRNTSIYLPDEVMNALTDVSKETKVSVSNCIAKAIRMAYPLYFSGLNLTTEAIFAMRDGRFDTLKLGYINGQKTVMTDADVSEQMVDFNDKVASFKTGRVYHVFTYDSAEEGVNHRVFATIDTAREFMEDILRVKQSSIKCEMSVKRVQNDNGLDVYTCTTADGRNIVIHVEPWNWQKALPETPADE